LVASLTNHNHNHEQKITVHLGDITKLSVDAIVNAANETLLVGGGVNGAIHAAAGPGLLAECRKHGSCPTGEAKITKGYDLPAKHVIHTVGPVYRGGVHGEDHDLHQCYVNSLKLADAHNIKSIAFPAIATGVYAFPRDHAAHIAVSAVRDYLPQTKIEHVILVAFDTETYDLYHHALKFK